MEPGILLERNRDEPQWQKVETEVVFDDLRDVFTPRTIHFLRFQSLIFSRLSFCLFTWEINFTIFFPFQNWRRSLIINLLARTIEIGGRRVVSFAAPFSILPDQSVHHCDDMNAGTSIDIFRPFYPLGNLFHSVNFHLNGIVKKIQVYKCR